MDPEHDPPLVTFQAEFVLDPPGTPAAPRSVQRPPQGNSETTGEGGTLVTFGETFVPSPPGTPAPLRPPGRPREVPAPADPRDEAFFGFRNTSASTPPGSRPNNCRHWFSNSSPGARPDSDQTSVGRPRLAQTKTPEKQFSGFVREADGSVSVEAGRFAAPVGAGIAVCGECD
jgi:hypothetical protein